MATRDGMRVLLLDMDPQASATAWWKRRSDESPELIHGRGDALPDILEQAQGYDLMIADTAATGVLVQRKFTPMLARQLTG
jgi:cellulose biosynthesis protein BcsQ